MYFVRRQDTGESCRLVLVQSRGSYPGFLASVRATPAGRRPLLVPAFPG
ncbi:MAG: hypothetical protein R6X14_05530 [bacterium]